MSLNLLTAHSQWSLIIAVKKQNIHSKGQANRPPQKMTDSGPDVLVFCGKTTTKDKNTTFFHVLCFIICSLSHSLSIAFIPLFTPSLIQTAMNWFHLLRPYSTI